MGRLGARDRSRSPAGSALRTRARRNRRRHPTSGTTPPSDSGGDLGSLSLDEPSPAGDFSLSADTPSSAYTDVPEPVFSAPAAAAPEPPSQQQEIASLLDRGDVAAPLGQPAAGHRDLVADLPHRHQQLRRRRPDRKGPAGDVGRQQARGRKPQARAGGVRGRRFLGGTRGVPAGSRRRRNRRDRAHLPRSDRDRARAAFVRPRSGEEGAPIRHPLRGDGRGGRPRARAGRARARGAEGGARRRRRSTSRPIAASCSPSPPRSCWRWASGATCCCGPGTAGTLPAARRKAAHRSSTPRPSSRKAS